MRTAGEANRTGERASRECVHWPFPDSAPWRDSVVVVVVVGASSCGVTSSARMDEATVAAIAAALRANAALARDGTASSSSARAGAGASTSALAQEAYDKLQFDYPIIRAQALDALATTMRKALRVNDVEGMRACALTTMVVRGVTEGAQAGMAGKDVGSAFDARDAAADVKDDAVDDVRRAYQNLCTVICVELPHTVLKMDDDDAYELLRLYVPDAEARESGEAQETTALDDVDDVRAVLPETEVPTVTRIYSSDDDDWQPLESTSTWFVPPLGDGGRFERMSKREAVDAKLHALVGELMPSRVGADALKTSARASWEMTNAGDSVLKLFEACCGEITSEARRALRTIPLRVLRERWARVPIGTFGIDSGLARALVALKFDGVDKAADVVDQRIALELLAYLCVQLGADTIGGCGVDVSHASISATARSKLWVHVNKAVPAVTIMLENSLRVMARERENTEWQDSVGLNALLLTYYVGNANAFSAQEVGERLVRTGCLRALVNLFIATRTLPFAEAIRRALLLACLSSDAVYNFVSQVPTALDALTAAEFAEDGMLAGHGAIWPAALRHDDADTTMSRYFDYFAEHMDDEHAVMALQNTLPLLRACARASRAGGRPLYVEGGPVTRALQRVYAKTTEAVLSTTRARNELRNATLPQVDDDDEDKKKNVERPVAPDVEKRRECIVDISRTLKILISPSDDAVAGRKAD